jgi:hypothetical protein
MATFFLFSHILEAIFNASAVFHIDGRAANTIISHLLNHQILLSKLLNQDVILEILL